MPQTMPFLPRPKRVISQVEYTCSTINTVRPRRTVFIYGSSGRWGGTTQVVPEAISRPFEMPSVGLNCGSIHDSGIRARSSYRSPPLDIWHYNAKLANRVAS